MLTDIIEQSPVTLRPLIRIGVDVGGTFTDLIATDGKTLHVAKIPSTPPDFHTAVIEAVRLAAIHGTAIEIIHGSTVATNALLERAGKPVAFITTEGFGDMLLIGRQNRPSLYALNIDRSPPLAPEGNGFTVRERVSATGEVVTSLDEADVDGVIAQIQSRGIGHVAVCLLFSFINPAHEQFIGRKCEQAGLVVSLSSTVLPEFREYERASTTVINAALRPVVGEYLAALQTGLGHDIRGHNDNPHARQTASPHGAVAPRLKILHSSGGTLTVDEASASAARLVLSGPAGGVMGAAFMAQLAGLPDVITYDMGGTSTDVAVILNGQPQWTTSTSIDGLPIGLPMFDIHTVGAGGGSVAFVDTGGALRVGPRSSGAMPGPACYHRGGIEPTVTDANVVLGRIVPDHFLGGAMRIERDLAIGAIARISAIIGKSVSDTALGIVKVAEANMEHAIRGVTSRRGHDPRRFALVSFGGAGGLHACSLAESLDIPRVLIPPYCGVLSALGMVVAPPVADASRTVVHLGNTLDDNRLIAELGSINGQTIDMIPFEETERVEVFADVRFRGQSHELKIRLDRPGLEHVSERFSLAYRDRYGSVPAGRAIEIVTLRIRRYGRTPKLQLPAFERQRHAVAGTIEFVASDGTRRSAPIMNRAQMPASIGFPGPLLLIDPEATSLVPEGWIATASDEGLVTLVRG